MNQSLAHEQRDARRTAAIASIAALDELMRRGSYEFGRASSRTRSLSRAHADRQRERWRQAQVQAKRLASREAQAHKHGLPPCDPVLAHRIQRLDAERIEARRLAETLVACATMPRVRARRMAEVRHLARIVLLWPDLAGQVAVRQSRLRRGR